MSRCPLSSATSLCCRFSSAAHCATCYTDTSTATFATVLNVRMVRTHVYVQRGRKHRRGKVMRRSQNIKERHAVCRTTILVVYFTNNTCRQTNVYHTTGLCTSASRSSTSSSREDSSARFEFSVTSWDRNFANPMSTSCLMTSACYHRRMKGQRGVRKLLVSTKVMQKYRTTHNCRFPNICLYSSRLTSGRPIICPSNLRQT